MAETDMNTLTKNCKLIRANLTRFITYFRSIQDIECTLEIFNQLSLRLQRAEPLLSEFSDIQNSIDCVSLTELADNRSFTDAQAVEAAEQIIFDKGKQEKTNFKNTYFNIMASVKSYLANYNKNNLTVSAVTLPPPAHNISTPSSSGVNLGVKLPSLNLPTFSGLYGEWMQFHDIFKSLTNCDEGLTNIQKFYYLKTSLKGEAAAILDSLEVSDRNYTIAWQLLKDRFENKKIIVNNYLKHIFELESITKESRQALRHLYDTVTKHVRCLSSLGLPTHEWDTILIFLITNKFGHNTKRA